MQQSTSANTPNKIFRPRDAEANSREYWDTCQVKSTPSHLQKSRKRRRKACRTGCSVFHGTPYCGTLSEKDELSGCQLQRHGLDRHSNLSRHTGKNTPSFHHAGSYSMSCSQGGWPTNVQMKRYTGGRWCVVPLITKGRRHETCDGGDVPRLGIWDAYSVAPHARP